MMEERIALPSSPKNFTHELAILLERSHGLKCYFDREEILAAYLNSTWYNKAHPIWAVAMFANPTVFKQCAEEYKIEGGYSEFRKRLLRGFHKDHSDNWMDIVKIESVQAVKGRKITPWAILIAILGGIIELIIQFGWDFLFPNGNSF